jgi:hypothetical protein
VGFSATLSATVYPAAANIPVTFSLDGAVRGTGTTNALGVATLTVGSLVPNVYKVDAVAGSGCATSIAYLAVYDPTGGFVTGGGWINSPAGAYRADPTAIGKANFGFVSKYKKGSDVPTGETEFQFKTGNLNFNSSSYDLGSLVIASFKATYKGSGTINGAGNYGFMVTAVDGQIAGGGGSAKDRFRMRIWNKNDGNKIVYDNQFGLDENAVPTTELGGGSIVIHSDSRSRMAAAPIVIATEPVIQPVTLTAYPNPTTSFFSLKVTGGTTEKVQLNVFDAAGRKVHIANGGTNQTYTFGQQFTGGTYFVVVAVDSKQQTLKLIKQN